MASHRCILCGTDGATCGQPTAMRTVPVDAVVRGAKGVGDQLIYDDLTPEEREEIVIMNNAMHLRRMRFRPRNTGDGTMPAPENFSLLSYVECPDGITRKMKPEDAKLYVEQNPDAKITREGRTPDTSEDRIIGATKAKVGEMFDADGKQIADVQPMTSRTFSIGDRVNPEAVRPAIGAPGAAPNPHETVTPTSGVSGEASGSAGEHTHTGTTTPRTPRVPTKPD